MLPDNTAEGRAKGMPGLCGCNLNLMAPASEGVGFACAHWALDCHGLSLVHVLADFLAVRPNKYLTEDNLREDRLMLSPGRLVPGAWVEHRNLLMGVCVLGEVFCKNPLPSVSITYSRSRSCWRSAGQHRHLGETFDM